VTGFGVPRAGGGGAAGGNTAGTNSFGGGSGTINASVPATAGTANTGGGGGGGIYGNSPGWNSPGGAGGSGIVILKYPINWNITIGAGLTGTTSPVGPNKVSIITQGTGNISWALA
jgi:hypothetical protein